ncbi:S26 family signal peptidase [Sulfitobacter mediterraneus]|nr:S26 family signal peptidase [Sulfitobacter mediterraneus]MBM1311894.1 S26 family signal peptidase [Sulfitobacter mediterraneus]MBM1324137.1 S26 family signal peptidase [Sulfitobacter mediterraneus]MBM1328049.1 S26 family signal peptidase [Sulfitobacter mediterraneus]MBM1399397.1 S26 family signal peptidase [Sulfitobacter mediterraneus]MBM1403283.1 S26 family signal peptidase [Sulfitobacter mediterraneus]
MLAVAQIDRAPRLVWNASASVPVGLYVVRASNPPPLGDLVAVRLPDDLSSWVVERGYVGADTLLLKRVAAVSGMTVCRDGVDIAIDGTVVAQAASADRHGRPLPRWTGCITLGSDEVFLLVAGVADSLDGRYFGPFSADTILGRAIPLWTYGGAEDASS